MKRSKYIYMVAVVALSVVVLSCSPRLSKSDDTPPAEWIYGGDYPTDSLRLGVNWWECFNDSTLNAMVGVALKNNRDVEAAMVKIIASRQQIKVARSNYLPALSFNAESEATYAHSTKRVMEYTLEPTITWEISLFGALRNSSRKAKAQLAESEWAARAMRLSVAAQVAESYFTLLEAKGNLAIAEQSYSLRQQEISLIDSLFRYGMSDGIARSQALSLLYSAQSDISTYRRAVEQTQLSLVTLLGENPRVLTTTARLLDVTIPPRVPIGLPSDLLERRPDIREKYFAMAAAAAEVGVARAARYPSISLTGSGGLLSSTIKGLTQDHPWGWSATAELIQPIFGFGRLKASERAARADYMVAMYGYEQSMLTAFSEVEQALVAVATYNTEREAMVDLVGANAHISQATWALYKSGMNDYLDVIDAERELYSSQMDLVGVIASQYIGYVGLFKVLGGGY